MKKPTADQAVIANNSGSAQFSTVARLAWPAILEQLLITLVSYVDAAMVGSLGQTATASVSITSSTVWLISGLLQCFAVGFSVQVAHAVGAGDPGRARSAIRQAITAVLLSSLVIMAAGLTIVDKLPLWLGAEPQVIPGAVGYLRYIIFSIPFNAGVIAFSAILRCTGDMGTPLLFTLGANVLNVILNALFIFQPSTISLFGASFDVWGAGMGVEGAALGTLLSLGCACGGLVMCLYLKKSPYRITLKGDYRLKKTNFLLALRLGGPVTLERLTICIGQVYMTTLVAGLGTVALAANHVAVTAEGLSYLPAYGIASAATTLLGQSVGAGNTDRAYKYGIQTSVAGFVLAVFMGALLFLFARPLATIFSPVPEVVELAASMLRIVAFAQPMFAVSIVLAGAFRGVGAARFSFYVGIACMLVVRLTLGRILVLDVGVGLSGVWLAMVADLCLRGIASIVYLRSQRWRKHCPN